MIHVEHLSKKFGDLEVLKDINLDVEEGEVVCIIGPSGSGKSTFLRCINQLEVPTDGVIEYEGKDITKLQVLIEKTVLYTETGRWIGESFLPEA